MAQFAATTEPTAPVPSREQSYRGDYMLLQDMTHVRHALRGGMRPCNAAPRAICLLLLSSLCSGALATATKVLPEEVSEGTFDL